MIGFSFYLESIVFPEFTLIDTLQTVQSIHSNNEMNGEIFNWRIEFIHSLSQQTSNLVFE